MQGPEHQWLQRMVGEWSFEMEAEAGPGQPPITDRGRESVRSLGGVWVLCESQGSTPDGDGVSSIMTLGYDPARGRFLGTFVASMMTHLWLYEGTLDAAASVLTLETEGPSSTEEGKTSRYRDTLEMRGDDGRVQTSSYLREDGAWHPFLTTHYRRTR
jgi:hypothetical protein